MRTLLTTFALTIVASISTMASSQAAIKLRNTYYYVVLESEYEGRPRDTDILNMNGDVLATVSGAFRRAVDIEGTGRLVDGRVINYAGRKDGAIRYLISPSHYGYGIGTCKLVPFHTVAVDPDVVPLGSEIYIVETDGMRLPDGSLHDGIWLAEDIGSAIKHDRVDLFVGDGDRGDILVAQGIRNLKPLTIKIIEKPDPKSCVYQER
ncbi:MAG: hypothetical protein HY074_09405 [Deltaproteobacteria bacterium]|nr:hypothetical protein [Deltaproteobacteria bacterium]